MRKLKLKERKFVDFCEKYFWDNGEFPNPTIASEKLKYSINEVNLFLETEPVQIHLSQRGLPWHHMGAQAETLTPLQMAAAMATTNFLDNRTLEQKLKSVGVSLSTYRAWLELPIFKAYVNNISEKNLVNARPQALTALANKIQSGDLKTLQYYFQVTGEFADNNTVQDFRLILQTVIEAIQKHVQDPEKLSAIAQEIYKVAPQLMPQTAPTSQPQILNGVSSRNIDSDNS